MTEELNHTFDDLRQHSLTELDWQSIKTAFLAWCEATPDKNALLILGPSRTITAGAVLEASREDDPWVLEVISCFSASFEQDKDVHVAQVIEQLGFETQEMLGK